MTESFWYRECPKCKQGRLFVTEDVTHGRLYLHCEECEEGYLRPEVADIPGGDGGFLTLLEDFETSSPSFERIVALGWEAVARHRFEN